MTTSTAPERLQLHDLDFKIFLRRDQIEHRIAVIGQQLQQRYAKRNPLFICILNGAFMFAADLIRYTELECEITFVKLSSYEGT